MYNKNIRTASEWPITDFILCFPTESNYRQNFWHLVRIPNTGTVLKPRFSVLKMQNLGFGFMLSQWNYSTTLRFNGHFSRWTWVTWYQNVSILDFIGAKDDGNGGDNWSYKAYKATNE